ncbi:hypothetical protein OIU74_025042, partial [Salix koriyanagi]
MGIHVVLRKLNVIIMQGRLRNYSYSSTLSNLMVDFNIFSCKRSNDIHSSYCCIINC